MGELRCRLLYVGPRSTHACAPLDPVNYSTPVACRLRYVRLAKSTEQQEPHAQNTKGAGLTQQSDSNSMSRSRSVAHVKGRHAVATAVDTPQTSLVFSPVKTT